MLFGNIYLIGCPEARQGHVLDVLRGLNIPATGTAHSVDEARQSLKISKEMGCLFLMYAVNAADLEEVTRLNLLYPEYPIIALVEEGRLLVGAERHGASQVVTVPIDPSDLLAAVECIARQRGFAHTKSYVIIISGVTGGCGATTLALNFMYEVSLLLKQQVILAEISPHLGSLAVYLNLQPHYTTADLFHSPVPFDKLMVENALAKYGDHMHVLVDEYRQFMPLRFSSSDLIRLIKILRTTSPVVLLDIPCNCADFYFEMLADADGVALVGEQTVPSIRSLKFVADSLSKVDGIGQILTVLNRFDPGKEGFELKHVQEKLGVPKILTYANDPVNVPAAIDIGQPVRLQNPHSPFLRDVVVSAREFVGMLTGQPASALTETSTFLDWLARVFRLRR